MKRRITLDWDFKDEFKMFKFMQKILSTLKKIYSIELKPSNSKGFHVLIWCELPKNISQKRILELREYFGDEKNQINLEKKHRFGRQTLFYKKKKLKNKRKKGEQRR